MSDPTQSGPVPGLPERVPAPPPRAGLHPLWLALSFAIFLYIGWILIAGLFQPRDFYIGHRSNLQLLFCYLCLDAFALSLSVAYLCVLEGRSFRLMGLPFDRSGVIHGGAGFAWGAGVISLTALLLFATHAARIFLFDSRDLALTPFWVAFFLLAAFFEELSFRGYALVRAADSLGPVAACLASSILFGLAHSANPQATLLSTFNTILAGVLLAVARLRSRALWMPVGLHFAWNFLLGPVFSFPVSGLIFNAAHISRSIAGPAWFSGGAYGPEGSVFLSGVVALATLLLLRSPLPASSLGAGSGVDYRGTRG